MASYKPGNRTKAALIANAKKLFYENGYDNTSVKEICVASDVPTSAITYHFGGKEHLAGEIYVELLSKIGELSDKVLEKCDDKRIKVAFPYYLWWELLYSDERIRRFVSEMYLHRIAQASANYTGMFVDYEDALAEKADSDQIRMLLITYLGTDAEILMRMQEGEQFDKDQLLSYIFRSQLRALGAAAGTEQALYEEMRGMVPGIKGEFPSFRQFAYTKPRGKR